MQDRRRFLATLSSAGAAGLICGSKSLAQEGPPETTTIRLAKNQSLCIQPQYVAEDLLRAEGFTTVDYVMTDGECRPIQDAGAGRDRFHFALFAAAADPDRCCGLSIEDNIPDHSAFSRARSERFRESDIFRRVFERVVEACIAAGLIGGKGFAVDASLIVADANKQRSIPGKDWDRNRDPETASRAVKEYLASLDDAAFGAASDVTPKFVSPSDPAAQWTGAMRGPAFFAYADNYLIDVKFGIIVDVEASRAIRQAEVQAAKIMIDRTEERFGLKPERLAADTAYGSAPTLDWLLNERKIAPHIPVIDKSKREDGTFSREDFTFDKERDIYTCPAGKILTTTRKVVNDEQLFYRASKLDCDVCP